MNNTDYPIELPEHDRPMVRFMNVSKSYGRLNVISHLDFDVAEGEMVSIIGLGEDHRVASPDDARNDQWWCDLH